jgi:toxin ParE1/3/4
MRALTYSPAAVQDLADIWEIIARADGATRADGVVARITAFCNGLAEFSAVGTRHDERAAGLRSSGIPGLARSALLFVVTPDTVTVVRIGYPGRDVWAGLRQLV